MVGASVIQLEEKEDKFVVKVEVSSPRLAPDATKRVNAKLKAISATGLIKVPRKVLDQVNTLLSLKRTVDESDFTGIRIAEVVSKSEPTSRGIGGSVTRYTIEVKR